MDRLRRAYDSTYQRTAPLANERVPPRSSAKQAACLPLPVDWRVRLRLKSRMGVSQGCEQAGMIVYGPSGIDPSDAKQGKGCRSARDLTASLARRRRPSSLFANSTSSRLRPANSLLPHQISSRQPAPNPTFSRRSINPLPLKMHRRIEAWSECCPREAEALASTRRVARTFIC